MLNYRICEEPTGDFPSVEAFWFESTWTFGAGLLGFHTLDKANALQIKLDEIKSLCLKGICRTFMTILPDKLSTTIKNLKGNDQKIDLQEEAKWLNWERLEQTNWFCWANSSFQL